MLLGAPLEIVAARVNWKADVVRSFGYKNIVLIVLLAVVAVILLYPWKTVVVPEWRVRIVDESGAPLRRTAVREVWQHYDIESKGHREDLTTDDDGYVTFPERAIRGPLAVRVVRRVISWFVPHQSSGADAFVIVLAPDYDTWSSNSALPGQPPPKQIVVKKNP